MEIDLLNASGFLVVLCFLCNEKCDENFLDSISEIHNESIPEKGYLFKGSNNLYLFGSNGTYSISMITFYDHMNRFKKDGLFDETIEFCKKAISGNYKATIGLPLNPVQKCIKIEESITSILNKKCEDDLKNSENTPSSVAEYFINLSKELKLKNWMTSQCLKIFQSRGLLKEYFNSIVNSDPTATYFYYGKDWVSELIENSGSLSINKFLLSLPKKVAPNQILIQMAKKNNDIDLLVDILIHKIGDYIDAAAVIWNTGNNEKLCLLYNNYLYPETTDIQISVSLIAWLFGVKRAENSDENSGENENDEEEN